jgi:hypothetical protein
MTREFWTKEEEELLRVEYPQKTEKELLSLFPGRSWHSLKRKANKLNIMKRDIWLADELHVLAQYKELSKEELLAKLPGRSWIAIKTMASISGVRKRFIWTKEAEDKLGQVYQKLNKQELIKIFPDTTWNTIQTKACELGLTGKRKDWTEAEISILKNNYAQYPVKISKKDLLALLPGRSWPATIRQAQIVNVDCIWIWTEEENQIMKDNYPKCTRKEMEKLLPNREWESMMSQAFRLGLHQNKKKFGPGYRWGQHKSLDVIENILGEKAIRDRRYDWMKSPKGYPLEIDGYFPNHNLAVEFQGQHHYKKGFLGHTNLKYQQQCDTIKRAAIKTKNIILLEIKYDEPLTEEHLHSRLEELGVLQCQRS